MLLFLAAFEIKISEMLPLFICRQSEKYTNLLFFPCISLLQINGMYTKALRMKGHLWEIQAHII